MQYKMLQKLGGGYTLEKLDSMEYYDYILLNTCILAETHAQNQGSGEKKSDEVQQFGTEADYPEDIEDEY